MPPTAGPPVSARGTGSWSPVWTGPTASSGTRTRCSSCPRCARLSSIATSRTASRRSGKSRRTCSIPTAPGLAEYDSGLRAVECTKRAAAFGLWGVWALFGPQLFADLVDVTFELGQVLYQKLCAAPDFEPVHEPQCNIVVFRHRAGSVARAPPERLGRFQMDLRRRLIESGEFYIVSTNIDRVGALRVTIINPLTTPDHLDQLLDALREHGRRLLAEM